MSLLRRRMAAAALAATAVLSVGCTRIQADIEVRADGMVEVDASYWLPPDADGYTDPCVWFNRQGIPGLEVAQLSQGASRKGCRAFGTTSVAALEGRHLVARQTDGTWEFTFRPRTRLWPATTPEGMDERVRDFDVVVRFPGPVRSADPGATVEGSTVRWTRASAMMSGLTAVASNEPGALDWAPVALGAAGALGAGGLGGWLLGRRRAAPRDHGGTGRNAGEAPEGGPTVADGAEVDASGQTPSEDVFFSRPALPEDPSVWAPGTGER